jgi:hypothetical protein
MFFVQTTMHAAKISLKAKLLCISAVHYLTSSEYWVQDGRQKDIGHRRYGKPTGYFPLSSFEV